MLNRKDSPNPFEANFELKQVGDILIKALDEALKTVK
jgi:hypothetical protein